MVALKGTIWESLPTRSSDENPASLACLINIIKSKEIFITYRNKSKSLKSVVRVMGVPKNLAGLDLDIWYLVIQNVGRSIGRLDGYGGN